MFAHRIYDRSSPFFTGGGNIQLSVLLKTNVYNEEINDSHGTKITGWISDAHDRDRHGLLWHWPLLSVFSKHLRGVRDPHQGDQSSGNERDRGTDQVSQCERIAGRLQICRAKEMFDLRRSAKGYFAGTTIPSSPLGLQTNVSTRNYSFLNFFKKKNNRNKWLVEARKRMFEFEGEEDRRAYVP
jgi:hypothetical protein